MTTETNDNGPSAVDAMAQAMCRAAVVTRVLEGVSLPGAESPTFDDLKKMVASEWQDYRYLAAAAASARPRERFDFRYRWFPIETAPMDRDVLLMVGKYDLSCPNVKVGHWVSQKEAFDLGEIVGDTGAFLICEPDCYSFYMHDDVSFWAEMPLTPHAMLQDLVRT